MPASGTPFSRSPALSWPLPAVDVTLGHSEGAALALLCAAQLCLAGRPPKAVWAFEPPRVSADGTLAALFAAHGVQLTLTQNGEDIVPMVPRLGEAWQHPAPLQRIGHPPNRGPTSRTIRSIASSRRSPTRLHSQKKDRATA